MSAPHTALPSDSSNSDASAGGGDEAAVLATTDDMSNGDEQVVGLDDMVNDLTKELWPSFETRTRCLL